jgi:hypothetical protein
MNIVSVYALMMPHACGGVFRNQGWQMFYQLCHTKVRKCENINIIGKFHTDIHGYGRDLKLSFHLEGPSSRGGGDEVLFTVWVLGHVIGPCSVSSPPVRTNSIIGLNENVLIPKAQCRPEIRVRDIPSTCCTCSVRVGTCTGYLY